MDLNDYWQENKRFVLSVAGGAAAFLMAYGWLASGHRDDVQRQESSRRRLQGELREVVYDARDRDAAAEDNEALRAAVDRLAAAAAFRPRPLFDLDVAAHGSASAQYLHALSEVRERLIPRANRHNARIDPQLGMPTLSPTREDEIERWLEALDVVETVADLAIDAGVRRIDEVQVRLDPALDTRGGVGRIERTRVKFSLEGPSRPLLRLVAATQRPGDGRPLPLDDVELVASRHQPGEARLELTVAIPRLHAPAEEDAS